MSLISAAASHQPLSSLLELFAHLSQVQNKQKGAGRLLIWRHFLLEISGALILRVWGWLTRKSCVNYHQQLPTVRRGGIKAFESLFTPESAAASN